MLYSRAHSLTISSLVMRRTEEGSRVRESWNTAQFKTSLMRCGGSSPAESGEGGMAPTAAAAAPTTSAQLKYFSNGLWMWTPVICFRPAAVCTRSKKRMDSRAWMLMSSVPFLSLSRESRTVWTAGG